MKVLRNLGGLLVLLAVLAGAVYADDVSGRWGVGAFMNYNVPTFGFRNWYSSASKFGMAFAYVPSQRMSVEVEYHRSHFAHGSLESRTFVWAAGDKKPHTSPDARSDMKINSLLANGIIHLGKKIPSFQASSFSPYLIVGGGFYRYKHNVSGMLWPAQKDALVIPLPGYTDQQFALGINAGFGVEAFIMNNVAVDLRGRYNFVVGQLRSMENWGLKETFPLMLFDMGAGLKFYFGKK
ncbi:MAG: hypothetical protein EXS64_19065 [Candidatus Latescibacteria bacterium]|nr:hypothetical protein [Candidatus Latescibacterota bacterium]